MMAPATVIAYLAAEAVRVHDDYDVGQPPGGEPAGKRYGITGVSLDNDGRWTHWIQEGVEYLIDFDGTGWRAAPADSRKWMDGHTRRLAGIDGPQGSYISWLPTANGRLELETDKRYRFAWRDGALAVEEAP